MEKKEGIGKPQNTDYKDIHMPKATPVGFIIGVLSGLFGFAMIWHMWLVVALSLLGIVMA